MSSGDSLLGANLACSSSGAYVTFCASGGVWVSADYGATTSAVSLASVVYAVAMSASGQYQTAVSTGTPASYIYVSSNYGVAWTSKQTVSTSNATSWAESLTVGTSGQYQFAGGGGGAGSISYYSTTYGTSWIALGAVLNRTAAGILASGATVFAIDSSNNSLMTASLSAGTPAETVVSAAATAMTSVVPKRLATDGSGNIAFASVSSATYAYSSTSGASFTSGTTPAAFLFLAYSASALWGCSATTLYSSANNGATWTAQTQTYTAIRSFAVSSDSTCLYVLTSAGALYMQTLAAATSLSPTVLSYLGGATSNIQAQLTAIPAAALAAANTWTNTNTFSGNVALSSTVASASTTTGALVVTGGAGVAGNVYVGGNIVLLGTTAATATGTGALRVAGGASVAGNVYVGGNIVTTLPINQAWQGNSVALGTGALATVGTGAGSVAVGYQALKISTSTQNTAMGYQVMTANTTGNYNVGVGASVLSALNSGNNNVGIGHQALTQTTTGNCNIGIGFQALYSNTAFSNNTAVGYQSLYSSAGGTNTAVGYQALYNNQNNSNTAVGFKALFASVAVGQNTAVGELAMSSLTGANFNTAVGYSAMGNNVSGGFNTCVGLSSQTNGNCGCAFGYNASTGSYNTSTAIGSSAICTSSNQIMLGTATETVVVPGVASILGNLVMNQTVLYTKGISDTNTIRWSADVNGPKIQGESTVQLSAAGVSAAVNSAGFVLSSGILSAPALTVNGATILNGSLTLNNSTPLRQIACGYSGIQATAGTVTVNFPFTFTNAPFINCTVVYSGVSYNICVLLATVSTTNFTYNILSGGGSHFENYAGVNWTAVGGY